MPSLRLAEIYLRNADQDAALAELELAVEKGFCDAGWIEQLTVAMLDAVEVERRVLGYHD